MIPALISVSVVTSVFGCWPEARDTLRGTVKPVVMSWVVWAAILCLSGAAALSAGQLAAGVFTSAQGAECVVVAVLAARIPAADRDEPFRVPAGRYRVRLDMLCLPGAVTGLVLLAVLRDPAAAVTAAVATDALAYVPTVAHGWTDPEHEAWRSYAWYWVSAVAALAAARHLTMTAIGHPAFLVLAEAVTTAVILGRRRALATTRLRRIGREPPRIGPGPSRADAAPTPSSDTAK